MRVLIIMSSLLPGGAERVSLDLASHLVAYGHAVHLMIARQPSRICDVYSVPQGVVSHRARWGTEGKLTRWVTNFFLMKKLMHKLSPDWVISLGAQYRLISICGALKSCKVLLSERNYPPERYSTKEMKFVREVYRQATRVVFQTEGAAKCFSDLPQDKICIIPNAVRFRNTRWSGFGSGKVSFVGRLIEQKNPAMLLQAFALFHVDHPLFHLHLYGDGPLGGKMEELAESLGISESVTFHGQVKDVDEELSSSHMYVSTSNFEGISNSMLEALAIGVPTICTDCAGGGARLAVDDGVNGLLVPCGDVRALAEAMGRVADNAELANSLSTRAVDSSRQFSEDKIYSLWEEALK